ncbi:MAG: TolB family protein, partial [Pyrinomonadaceae bacterium]
TNDVYTVSADGSNQQRLTNDSTIHSYTPQWTPDGTKLSFGNVSVPGTSIEVMNADGSGRMTLYTPPQGGFSYDLQGFTWSPDSSKLALWFSIGEGQGGNACVVNGDGTGLVCLGSDAEYISDPQWSPDSARLAFGGPRFPIGSNGIDIINADGTGRVPLTSAPGISSTPKWRPGLSSNTPVGTNVTVTANGATLTFANVATAGQTSVTPIDPATAGTLPGGYTLINGSLAFQITTTAIYSGAITVCIVESSVNDQTTFDGLRILHGEGGMLLDRTILPPDVPAPDFGTRTICARVTSLSPFVIAKLAYGVQTLFDQTKPVRSGSTLPIRLQLTNANGVNVSSASLGVTALSVLRVSTNTSNDVQDSGNANPDNNFRYAGGAYIFNLSTRGYATGTYLLRFKAGADLVNYTVQFQVK